MLFVTMGLILLCAITGILAIKYLPKHYFLLVIQTGVAAIVEFCTYTIKLLPIDDKNIINSIICNWYILIEFYLICLFGLFYLGKYLSKVFVYAAVGYTLFWIFSIYSQSIFQFLNKVFVLGCFILTIEFILIVIIKFRTFNIFKDISLTIIVTSIIIYFSTCIPLFAFLKYLINNKPNIAYNLFSINIWLSLGRYALITFAFLKCYQDRVRYIAILNDR